MNESEGIVVRVEGTRAWVRPLGAGSACGGCAQRSGCATAGAVAMSEGAAVSGPTRLLCVPNGIRAGAGDAVVIRAADGTVLRAAALVYGLPLLLALAGASSLLAWTGSEAAALGGLLAGLAGGFLVARRRALDVARGEPIFSIASKQSS